MDRLELAKRMYGCCHLTGDFLLRSGKRTGEYFDKYQFESDPVLLKAIAEGMAKLLPKGTEMVAGLELGGVPLATAISLHTGIPSLFVRKAAKKYGTCRLAEGPDFTGKKVCLVEDVITTGGAFIEGDRALREDGATVLAVVCAIYRGEGTPDRLGDVNLRALFTMSELSRLGFSVS